MPEEKLQEEATDPWSSSWLIVAFIITFFLFCDQILVENKAMLLREFSIEGHNKKFF